MAAQLNPLSADCVGCWRLNETSASDDGVDATGNGNTAVAQGSPAVVTDGVFGGARQISAGHFHVAYHADFDAQAFTVVGWYRFQSANGWGTESLFARGYSSLIGYSWKLYEYENNDGWLAFKVCLSHAGSGTYVLANSSMALTPGEWYHVAATWDGEFATLYINGYPHAKILNQTGIGTIPFDTSYVHFGSSWQTWDADDWAYYNTCKDEAWVYEQFTGSAGPPADAGGFIPVVAGKTLMLYRANELVSGEALRSALGDGRHATARGAPEPVAGYQDGARDIQAVGEYFETWNNENSNVDVLTAIAVFKASGSGRVWFKTHTRNISGVITSCSWMLGLNSMKPEFLVALSGGTIWATADNAIDTGRWYMLVGTFDGSNIKVYGAYLDAVAPGTFLLKSAANATGTTDILYTTEECQVSSTYEARGIVDEVALMGPGPVAESGYPWVADETWVEALFLELFTKAQGPQLISMMLEAVLEPTAHRLNVDRQLLEVTGSAAAGKGPQLAALLLEHIPDEHVHRLGAVRRKT